MKKLVILIMCLVFGVQLTFAQRTEEEKAELAKTRREMLKEASQERKRDSNGLSVTTADVGEADSFGKNAAFLGVATSGSAIVYLSCDPTILLNDLGIVLGPDDRCLAVPVPNATTAATFTDMARITFPARSASNIFYMVNNHSISWDLSNDTMANVFGQMSYSPRVTIESVALNDPAAINPDTGLPMNGSFTTTGNGSKFRSGVLAAGAFDSFVDSYSRANTLGFSREYFRALGLSNAIINNIFRNPMTIRLGMRLSVRNVSFGQFTYTARFLGN